MTANINYQVLIIDDEISIRESLTEFLCDYDIATTAVASAEEGLDLLQQQFFELVIVDIRLPEMNGDQFVHAAHKLHGNMKFIIHTGSVHFRITPELTAIGMTDEDIFFKPIFDLEQLLARTIKVLPRSKTDE